MSDSEDYEYEYDESVEEDGDVDYGDDETFEYTDDEENIEEGEVDLENAYYNAKGLRDGGEFEEAAETFENVIRMEIESNKKQSGASSDDGQDDITGGGDDCATKPLKYHGLWSYKAIKQLVKLHLRTVDGAKVMKDYSRMLRVSSSADSAISPNAVEKGVNGMLERVSSLISSSGSFATEGHGSLLDENELNDPRVLARHVYDATLQNFHPTVGVSPNERLWFKTNLKYGQLLYEMNETAKLQVVIRDLLRSSGQSTGLMESASMGSGNHLSRNSVESIKIAGNSGGTHVMEIAALQIQLYSRLKDTKKLRQVYQQAMAVRGGIPHPRTLALIQEFGGKMHMSERNFDEASQSFFQAFKSYDEAGDRARLRCLKYLVMASMLHASSINPFDSHEARAHRDDPEIVAMTNLVQAFHNNDIRKFEYILRKNDGRIMDDEFVREHVADLLRTIRTQVLIRTIEPYTRISLSRIAKDLNDIPVEDVESLLVSLILDGRLSGKIDQVHGVLTKPRQNIDSDVRSTGTTNGPSSGMGTSVMGGTGPISYSGGMSNGGWYDSGNDGFERREVSSVTQLTVALEHLTSAVTKVGIKGSFHQQIMH